MTIDRDMPIGDIAREIPDAPTVFEKWNVDYFCHGETSLAEACGAVGIGVEELLEDLRDLERNAEPLVRQQWSGESLETLARHVTDHFHQPARRSLDTLLHLASEVESIYGTTHSELRELTVLLGTLATRVRAHMIDEERTVFPWVTMVEHSLAGVEESPVSRSGSIAQPIHHLLEQHDEILTLIEGIRTVTSGYAAPCDACPSYRELYRSLQRFEASIRTHLQLENSVYFERAVSLEEQIVRQSKCGCEIEGAGTLETEES